MSGAIFLTLTMFLVLFSGLLVSYGLATPSIVSAVQGPINCDVNQVPTQTCAFPAWRPPNIGNVTTTQSGTSQSLPWYLCWTYLPSCWAGAVTTISNVGNAIWNGLQLIAYAMGWFAIATFVFFNKLVQAILLIFGITQVMTQTGGFIVFLPYFFLSYLIFYIMYGISMLKPGGSGLPG